MANTHGFIAIQRILALWKDTNVFLSLSGLAYFGEKQKNANIKNM